MRINWVSLLERPLIWNFKKTVILGGQIVSSPFGYVYLYRNEEALVALTLSLNKGELRDYAPWPIGGIQEMECVSLLERDAIPIELLGTPFQNQVWQAMKEIPFKETWSYKELALSMGISPNYSRAVGNAVGANPISLLIPCHRVIASDGSLGGFRWSSAVKQGILDFEKKQDKITKSL